MPRRIDVGELQLSMYESLFPSEIAALRDLSERLKGARVLHINATPYGGGVSELLRSIVPMERALGIDSNWVVISGDERFFHVTKSFHNALQGDAYKLTPTDKETYLAYNKLNADALTKDYDFIFVNDPQPVAIRHMRPDIKARWIWRCHIDTSNPNPQVWQFLLPFIHDYDAVIFTMREFVPEGITGRVDIIPPGIDPLSPKNMELPEDTCRHILNWVGAPKDGPIICQVSRFDPWKDPLGVIAAYRLIAKERPSVRLILIGSMALDDPQGWEIYDKIIKAKNKDGRIHIFTNFMGVADIQVNAFQRVADIVIQKSKKEGFGLVVSETLWKGTPIVAGRAGGIPMQLAGGGGFLVDSVEETAKRALEVLDNPGPAAEEGRRGRRYIREHFLIMRLIKDHLNLLLSLA